MLLEYIVMQKKGKIRMDWGFLLLALNFIRVHFLVEVGLESYRSRVTLYMWVTQKNVCKSVNFEPPEFRNCHESYARML